MNHKATDPDARASDVAAIRARREEAVKRIADRKAFWTEAQYQHFLRKETSWQDDEQYVDDIDTLLARVERVEQELQERIAAKDKAFSYFGHDGWADQLEAHLRGT